MTLPENTATAHNVTNAPAPSTAINHSNGETSPRRISPFGISSPNTENTIGHQRTGSGALAAAVT